MCGTYVIRTAAQAASCVGLRGALLQGTLRPTLRSLTQHTSHTCTHSGGDQQTSAHPRRPCRQALPPRVWLSNSLLSFAAVRAICDSSYAALISSGEATSCCSVALWNVRIRERICRSTIPRSTLLRSRSASREYLLGMVWSLDLVSDQSPSSFLAGTDIPITRAISGIVCRGPCLRAATRLASDRQRPRGGSVSRKVTVLSRCASVARAEGHTAAARPSATSFPVASSSRGNMEQHPEGREERAERRPAATRQSGIPPSGETHGTLQGLGAIEDRRRPLEMTAMP
mmetsp:Transcript_49247/g.122361  ORF Transcript_49247/g.122361 Transcript_49247/m.122361 type:complete len:286 (-) Transcript_49247:207-1064(-)